MGVLRISQLAFDILTKSYSFPILFLTFQSYVYIDAIISSKDRYMYNTSQEFFGYYITCNAAKVLLISLTPFSASKETENAVARKADIPFQRFLFCFCDYGCAAA